MSVEMLRVSEIFYSLQGETRTTGIPTVFIRLTGCPLRCRWCDTEYAFSGGELLSIDDVVARVSEYDQAYVTVTGGEPLAQPGCKVLLSRLLELGGEVSLETSGAIDLSGIDIRIVKVVDFKPPGSGESHRNRYENIQYLGCKDQVKFVIADRDDYKWSVSKLIQYQLSERVSDVLFSPVSGELSPELLAEWILEDRLPVRFQIQLHRIIWGDRAGV